MLGEVLVGFVASGAAGPLTRTRPRVASPILSLLPVAILGSLWWRWLGADGDLITSIPWVPGLGVDLAFRLDGLSLLFSGLICGIGSLVLLYTGSSIGAVSRRDRQRQARLLALLLAFMSSMLGLVLADHLLVLFIFWELTSITSYLLIGFDHEASASRRAALQALLVTGAGGLALLAGVILLAQAAGTWHLSELAVNVEAIRWSPLRWPMLVLLLAGCLTKSAQTPFHFWLPNAMVAPTPVSAYLHSATMVKAGVYLAARLNPVFSELPGWSTLLVTFGAVTLVTAGVMSLFQHDLKRVLAYSTIATLGLLMLLIGLASPTHAEAATTAATACVLLLLAHAFYKATLFLIAGTITDVTGQKDARLLSGLRAVLPVTMVGALLAAASMIGLPPWLGYIAKESALAGGWESPVRIVAVLAMVIGVPTFVVAALRTGVSPFLFGTRREPGRANEPAWGMVAGPLILGVVGLVLGIVPALATLLVAPAVHGVLGDHDRASIHVELWHGPSMALLLDVVLLTLGVLLWVWRDSIERWTRRLSSFAARGPQRAYERLVEGLLAFATFQTNVLQSGYLRRYVMVVILFTLLVVGMAVGAAVDPAAFVDALADITTIRPVDALLVVMMIVAAIATVRSSSRMAAVIALSAVGVSITLIFVLYGAPDLALTQILIETLMVILFVLVLQKLPHFIRRSSRATQVRDLAIAGSGGLLMTVLVLLASHVQLDPGYASTFYRHESVAAGHGRNVVNVILVDFRVLDTLGEITVLAVAAIGVVAMTRSNTRSRSRSDPGRGRGRADVPGLPGAPGSGAARP